MTLVETLVAVFILTLVMTMVATVLLSAQVSSRAAERWADQTEQLRMAMNQLGEDTTYARWCCTDSGAKIVLHVYQPLADYVGERIDEDGVGTPISWHSDWENWSGWLIDASGLELHYEIQDNGDLVRTVKDKSEEYVYSRQVLVTGLVPHSTTTSRFEVDASRHLVKAILQTTRNGTGGSGVAEVQGQWYLR